MTRVVIDPELYEEANDELNKQFVEEPKKSQAITLRRILDEIKDLVLSGTAVDESIYDGICILLRSLRH